jgi:hypothetical protein
VGRGSAGRSAGLLLPDPGPAFRDIEQAHGLRAARTAFESWRRASLEGAALLRRLNIKCGLEAVTPLIVAARDDERMLRRELDARVKAGAAGTWLARKPLAVDCASRRRRPCACATRSRWTLSCVPGARRGSRFARSRRSSSTRASGK